MLSLIGFAMFAAWGSNGVMKSTGILPYQMGGNPKQTWCYWQRQPTITGLGQSPLLLVSSPGLGLADQTAESCSTNKCENANN